MKILMVTRLFSGLEAGLHRGEWSPNGVPSIYKLINELAATDRHELKLVLTCKDGDSTWTSNQDETLTLKGLPTPVLVLTGMARFPKWLGRARGYFREISQIIKIWNIIKFSRPDLIYVDRGNVYVAAVIARFTDIPVVWRVMGVPPSLQEMLNAKGLVAYMSRLAYRSPFAKVICSMDGSGGDVWMKKALHHKVGRVILLHGFDPLPEGQCRPEIKRHFLENHVRILFLARLVQDKGCLEFVQAISEIIRQSSVDIQAVVVGDGPFRLQMEEMAKNKGIEKKIFFVGSVPHEEVLAIHRACDIYVSMNRMCNLTNANIEALAAGDCLVFPHHKNDLGIDEDTLELIPENVAWRYGEADDIEGLVRGLVYLCHHPEERKKRAAAAEGVARMKLQTWSARIQKEIDILQEIAGVRTWH